MLFINIMKTHFVYNQIQKLPRTLYYKLPYKDGYNIIATDAKKKVGIIYTRPIKVGYKEFLQVDFLGIRKSERRKGYGTEAINFAKKLSELEGCDGRVILTADITPLETEIAPHPFYRKNNFTCNNKILLKKIDEFIKKGEEMPFNEAKATYMFYIPKKENFFDKIKKYFKK